MEDYWDSNGADKDYMGRADHWGGCRPTTPDTRCPVGDYKEFLENPEGQEFGYDQIVIYEPCNYVSNLAFYHSATRICDYPDFSVDEVY